LTILQKYDDDILALRNIEEIEREIKESDTINLKVLDYKTRINQFLTVTTNPVTPSTAAVITPSALTPPPVKARLPKLELHKFKGNTMSWIPFWDSFKSAVHENPSLSKIDKFNYLHSLLEGSASRVIQGLQLSDTNYDTAVSLFQERFGDPQTIISAHMDELVKLLEGTTDRQQPLRILFDKLTVHTRSLASLGKKMEEYGSLLIPIIMPKLPNEVHLRIARDSKGEVWKLETILETIEVEVEASNMNKHSKKSTRRRIIRNPVFGAKTCNTR